MPCLWGCLVVIRGDGQQYRQVGLGALGSLTVLRNCKRYYPRGMKTALSGSVREDRQVKTDDVRPGDCPIALVPPLHMQLWRPGVRHIWPGFPRGWRLKGLGGQTVETKGDLSEQDQTKARWLPTRLNAERARDMPSPYVSSFQNDTSQGGGRLLFHCLQYVASFCLQQPRVLMGCIRDTERRAHSVPSSHSSRWCHIL